MKNSLVKEGKAEFYASLEDKISKKLNVFYNPRMELNRSMAVLLIKSYFSDKAKPRAKPVRIALPLAASGARGIRIALECPDVSKEILFNDMNEDCFKAIKKGLKKNNLAFPVFKEDANEFILKQRPFDYIDIDPFGSPNPFLDSAVKSIRNKGIIAVTATDTAALCGTYPQACRRKYWAVPIRNFLMKEIGLRILIRKVQMAGMQYDKALFPALSYCSEHYFRVFFHVRKGKEQCNRVFREFKHLRVDGLDFEARNNPEKACFGPLWAGELNDDALIKEMLAIAEPEKDPGKLLKTLADETETKAFGFYELHEIAKKLRTSPPRIIKVIDKLREKGFCASRTHFSGTGVKTKAGLKEIEKIIKQQQQ
ncbi:MAG TPA: tRNA (guanine(10)-N(2))-dimethyltransferase [Candidatus Woesearchaeota archaeon]|nr:tRNA (guanine(10)-N(2))-dimethyltransferase [Candidatus Woesearchaeota archaeon]